MSNPGGMLPNRLRAQDALLAPHISSFSASGAITAAQFLTDLDFTGAGPWTMTLPTAAAISAQLAPENPVNYVYEHNVNNETGNTLTFTTAAGWSVPSYTVVANKIQKFQWRFDPTGLLLSPYAWIAPGNSGMIAGTVTSVATGAGLAGGPITGAGTLTVDTGLGALDTLALGAGTGFITQTGVNTFAERSLTSGAGISIGNAAGVAANPTIAVTNSLSALNTLVGGAGTGFVVQTAANTVIDQTLTAGNSINITNTSGAASPVFSVALSSLSVGISSGGTVAANAILALSGSGGAGNLYITGPDLTFTGTGQGVVNILTTGRYRVSTNFLVAALSGNIWCLIDTASSTQLGRCFGTVTAANAYAFASEATQDLVLPLTAGMTLTIVNKDIASATISSAIGTGGVNSAGNLLIQRIS